ncbi:MAG: AMP-binding protein [Pseudomonadota bacterium]|nr:AMP-binding protein [Pseudomonadota bacterium]
MNLAQLLSDTASQYPGAPALACGNRVLANYSEHAGRSAGLGGALLGELGLKKGDRIALAMANTPAYSEIMFGAWHAGLSAVPMNSRLHSREFAYILKNSGAKACFVSDELADSIATAQKTVTTCEHIIRADSPHYESLLSANAAPMANADNDALAWLFYTSGTTGRPKGAMLTHGNLRSVNSSYLSNVDQIASNDCIIHAAPYSHGSGIYMLVHVECGACQVIPGSGGFDPDEVIDLIEKWQGATLFLAPTMVTRLMNAPRLQNAETTNLKTIVYGGAPMYLEDCLKALKLLGPKLVQIYGQGEAPMTITSVSREVHTQCDHPKYHERLASVGTAQSGVEVRVVNTDDTDVQAGDIGEILVRGDVVMRGYWNNPDASSKTLRGGWLHTGDMGVFDSDGYLTLKDRSKDLIISGGSNIYPREIEEILLTHSGVQECSVIGKPDQDWGEKVIAFIVPEVGTDVRGKDLDALCLKRIARYKRPREYVFVGSLPKNNYGKVLKTELRKRLDD